MTVLGDGQPSSRRSEDAKSKLTAVNATVGHGGLSDHPIIDFGDQGQAKETVKKAV
jgi:hypothetical protein